MKITGDDIINTRKKFDLNRQDFAILADIDISHLIFFEKHHHKTIINPYFIEVATKILSATSLALFPNYHLHLDQICKSRRLGQKYNKIVTTCKILLNCEITQVRKIIDTKKAFIAEMRKLQQPIPRGLLG